MIERTSAWVRYGTECEMEQHIRPMFRQLVLAAHASGIQVSVVTFSGQTELIQGALRIAFPEIGASGGGDGARLT